MDHRTAGRLLATVALLCLSGKVATARDLTFAERVRSQRAIDRVYYSHQTGVRRPFEDAVPVEASERTVRRSLEEFRRLDRIGVRVDRDALLKESERIERESRLPERLDEIRRALGGDPDLFLECFVRPVLVSRLSSLA